MTHSNRLIHETSPYLLQHAHNPVDWYPWGEEALARAKREDKPILLSIGYSACHWCHVMEHESFEDEGVARAMNEHFVCIKVDREERPDLDKVYQTAHQLLARRAGGWPLTVFLTPDDLMPFFAGTYFPKEPRYGMSGFGDVLRRVAAAYREQRDAIRAQSESLRSVYARLDENESEGATTLSPEVLAHARAELRSQFDARYGGFGGAPKFPHATALDLLLRHATTGGDGGGEAREMVRHTLRAMAAGGLYDQLGGGFYRYSVDERWEIPHFEKMLYDNAQLLPLYADAALILDRDSEPSLLHTDVRMSRAQERPPPPSREREQGGGADSAGNADAGADRDLFRRVAEETGAWVMREMQGTDGGYYATLDADSEGHEGKYYAWATAELRGLLAPDEYAVVERRFGLDGAPNFEGTWHLNVRAEIGAIANELNLAEAEVAARLEAARIKLFAARERRVRPGRDEKILASWNGLMIKGMARAGRLLERAELIASAERALDFVRRALWRDGRLLATTKDGRAHLNAYLDDYVFLLDAALELLQARWRTEDLEFARALARAVLDRFEDKTDGGFYFTSHDHEPLVHRPKPAADEALPAGNAIAAQALLRLGHLLGESDFLLAAERTLQAHYGRIAQYPSAHGALLIALRDYLEPPQTLVLRGAGEGLREWRAKLLRRHAPERMIFAIPNDAADLPGILAERRNIADVTAYLCLGHACQPPVTDFEALEQFFENEATR